MKKRIVIGSVALIVIIVTIVLIRSCDSKEQTITIETVRVKIGSVNNSVTATGTIEAIKTVEVGTQVSGEIRKIYVDFNSQVKAGQLLAELDRKPLVTALTISEASLDDAKAEMSYQTATYNRIKALSDKKLVAESEYDLALFNFEKARTTLKTAQLNYDKAKINLEYAYIYSPIDGVVLSRAVDEGQTVAASFNTPTLFTIANDLTRMQVEASIDEADIGQVKNDQRVDFTVDAYPDQKFNGKVIQIRLEPVVTSNVVTYTVIVEAPNPDKKLMPGMTASITVYVEEANDVLTLASKTLRFRPDSALLAQYRMEKSGSNKSVNQPAEKPKPSMRVNMPTANFVKEPMSNDIVANHQQVWIKSSDDIHPVSIETGIDNDIDMQVLSGLKEGDEVVIAMTTEKISAPKQNQETARSPFMPKPPSRRNTTR
jgi:HlyD family secretion protein